MIRRDKCLYLNEEKVQNSKRDEQESGENKRWKELVSS